MAIGVYKYVRKTDLKIGEDIRIIGFDNTELGGVYTASGCRQFLTRSIVGE